MQDLIQHVPACLRPCSGKVFYSGRAAFSSAHPLYLLGLNPGGDPEVQATETIERHTMDVLERLPADWSAYRDEAWNGTPAGKATMQRRVLHLFDGLGLSPGAVPSSNLVFQRSRREADLAAQFKALADVCWPLHASVVRRLRPRAIVCFGRRAGNYVRGRLATFADPIVELVEQNQRQWKNLVYQNVEGLRVVVLTHPSIVDWTAQATDPTELVRKAMG